MGFFQHLCASFGRDYVMLQFHDGKHCCRPVRWAYGRPFASPYLPDTAALLLPFGNLIGPSYLTRWFPVTSRISKYCALPTQGAGQ